MITDGFGNLITGGNMGGKSSINYKPYGEIHITDSGGPDVSKFKYTGQEEDKESGLMYYKARYYDPALGRFLQADSVVMPESTFGLNRYMYVFGNPMKFGDRGGNTPTTQNLAMYVAYYLASQPGSPWSKEQAVMAAGWAFKGKEKTNSEKYFNVRGSQSNRDGGQLIHDISNTVKWMSKGLKHAADAFNRATGQDYERRIRKKVNYGQCAAGLPLDIFTAGSLTGLCLAYTAAFEFGARGGYDQFSAAGEGYGTAGDTIDYFGIGAEYGIVRLIFGSGAGLFVAFLGVGAMEGNRIHERNENHRAFIWANSCSYIANKYNKEDDAQLLGQIWCNTQYQKLYAK